MQKGAYRQAEENLKKGLEIVKDKNKSLTHSAYGLYVHLNVAKGDTLTAIKYIDTLAIQAKTFKSFPKYHEAILNQLLAFKHIAQRKSLSDNFTSLLLSKTEEERKRIASDLHDSVSNELVNLRHALENNSFKLKAKIDTILEEVRNISRNLSPTLFDKLGLKESVEQLTERAQNQHSFLLTSDIDYTCRCVGGKDNHH